MNNNRILARMKGIRQTVQVANAQKLVASSRIGQARRMLNEIKPYHSRIRQAIAELLVLRPELSSGFLDSEDTPEPKKPGMLIISADKGLAGGYTGNVMKFSDALLREREHKNIIVLGRRGKVFLEKAGHEVDDVGLALTDPPSFMLAEELSEIVMRMHSSDSVDCFDIAYTHFTSSVRLDPMVKRLFPLAPDVFGVPDRLRNDVVFEPSPDAVLKMLMPKYIKGFIYGCLVHAWASELASRIAAMDNAMRNGNEMLEKLALAYNRARQSSITQEITEIVAGASSMLKDD